MPEYDPMIKAVLDEMFINLPHVRPGKMFGFPAYYVGKKLCICLYEQGVGVKLPLDSVKRLLERDANVIPFQPYGKHVMRDWVQINLPDVKEYRGYKAIFLEAIHYLQTIQDSSIDSKDKKHGQNEKNR
jgi:hypothetical protein